MKIIQFINQNIPIWSVLKGDHACGGARNLVAPKLLDQPDFLSPQENALRRELLRTTNSRKWLYDYLCDGSFALGQLERKDLVEASTVWDGKPGLLEVAKWYDQAYTTRQGFRHGDVEKSWEAVKEVSRRRVVPPLIRTGDVWLEDPDERFDYHRTIWMRKRRDSKLEVIDGTHRMIATTWKYLVNRDAPFPKLFCIFLAERA